MIRYLQPSQREHLRAATSPSRPGVAPTAWGARGRFGQQPAGGAADAVRLVQQYLRIAERGGADIRLDVGLPYRPAVWPRAGLQPSSWEWQLVSGYPWGEPGAEHINVGELRAFLNTVKWRARSLAHLRSRWLHLIDSQVVASVIAMGSDQFSASTARA